MRTSYTTSYHAYLLWLTCLLTVVSVWSQTSPQLLLKSRVYQDSIVLRWSPTELDAWRLMNREGVVVTRTDNRTGIRETLTPIALKPYTLEQWKTLTDTTNIFVATAAQCLLGTNSVTPRISAQNFSNKLLAASEQGNRLAFAAYSADFSIEAAKGLAMRFVDAAPFEDAVYSYTLFVGGKAISNRSKAATMNTWAPKTVRGFTATAENGQVRLTWPKVGNNSRYSGYYVERAVEDGTFQRISPSIIKATRNVSGSDRQFFIDSEVAIGTQYRYRIIGVGSFADFGSYGTPVTITVTDNEPPPAITDFEVAPVKGGGFSISWEPEQAGASDLVGFRLWRSATYNGPYTEITTNLLPPSQGTFTDTDPIQDGVNFYIVLSEDQVGNQTISPIKMAMLPNESAPARPEGLQATIDSLGVVSIGWKLGKEADLLGYRVFRSDAPDQEFMQLTRRPVSGNFYSDTVRLKTLKRQLYYKVIAFDTYYKASAASDTIIVQLPDLVAPVAPSLRPLERVGDSVVLRWTLGASSDATATRIYQKLDEGNWQFLEEVPHPQTSFSTLADTKSKFTRFAVVAVDGSGLESDKSNIRMGYLASPMLDGKPKLTGQFDAETKTLRLQWEIAPEPKATVIVFRKSDNGWAQYAEVDSNRGSFIDRALFKNREGYTYQVKLVRDDGATSAMSNPLKVVLD
ncbi:hypothetical protein ABV409_15325 [Flagellimonas sp. DF-77]|uniref:hypothetical protein n=1 Tax=Flagellimonas algarum TaxID=3230298 RepID=UPI003399CDFE